MRGNAFIAGRYAIKASLGRGGGGEVFLVQDTLQGGRPVALKTVDIPQGGRSPLLADLKNEFATLSLLRHRNLARVFDFGVTAEQMYFTSEWVAGKKLLAATEGADFNTVFDLLAQILRAVDFIHKRGVLHLDLKPANILVTDPNATGEVTARLIDFGIAEWKRRGRIHEPNFMGTPPFAAPEIILEQEPSPASDIYSLGMIFHILFAKRFPFSTQRPFEILRLQAVRDPDYLPFIHPALPEAFSQLLHAMVARDPAARPASAGEVLEALNRCLGESFRLRDANAPARPLEESDFFFHPKLMAKLSQRLKKPGKKTLVLLGPSGSGKTRILHHLKASLQLQGLRSLYFKSASTLEECLAHPELADSPLLVDLDRESLRAFAGDRSLADRNSPILFAVEGDSPPPTLPADEVFLIPKLDAATLRRFFQAEIQAAPAGLAKKIITQSQALSAAELEESLQSFREAGRLVWRSDGWRWKGTTSLDLPAIRLDHARLWENRKQSLRLILESSQLALPVSTLEGLVGLAPGSMEETLEAWCSEGWLGSHWENGIRCFQATRQEEASAQPNGDEQDSTKLAEQFRVLYEEGKYSAGVALADALGKKHGKRLHPRVALFAARHWVAEGYPRQALDCLPTEALETAAERGLAWEILARAHHQLGDLTQSLKALDKADSEFRSAGDGPGIARAFNLRGTLAKDEAQFKEAERYFREATRAALQAGDAYLAGTAQTNLALAYQDQGKIDRALTAYRDAWKYCRKSSHPKLTNVLFHNWINLQHHMGRSTEAEKSCYEWMKLAVKHRYPEQEASALNYLALFAGQKHLLELQGSFLNQAMDMLDPKQSPRLLAQLRANRALLQWSLKNYPLAQADAENALQLCHRREDDPLLAWIYLVLGKVYRDRPEPDYEAAARFFAASRQNVEKNRTQQLLWEVEFNLGRLHKLLGEFPEAQRYFLSALSALDELERHLPPAFKESYLRDRKSDRIRWELENLKKQKECSEIPEIPTLKTGVR